MEEALDLSFGRLLMMMKTVRFTNFLPSLLRRMCQIYSKPLYFLRVNERMYNVVAPCKKCTLFVYISCKGKGAVHPRTGHEGQEEEMRYSSTLSLSSAIDGVGGQRHAPVTLSPGKDPVTTV